MLEETRKRGSEAGKEDAGELSKRMENDDGECPEREVIFQGFCGSDHLAITDPTNDDKRKNIRFEIVPLRRIIAENSSTI